MPYFGPKINYKDINVLHAKFPSDISELIQITVKVIAPFHPKYRMFSKELELSKGSCFQQVSNVVQTMRLI